MEIRFSHSPEETLRMSTQELRRHFLVQHLMQDDVVRLVYAHDDRLIIGGARPLTNPLHLPNHPELKADYFLERRELGVINVGGRGTVHADGQTFELEKLDAVYLGKGTREVSFAAVSPHDPPVFFLLSAPAHASYPNQVMKKQDAAPMQAGDDKNANKRTIYKYIHLDGIRSCQLVMGLTMLEPGSVWNSVPPHTHTRRTEVYFYFDVPAAQRVFHFMGQPQETRHLVMANHEAVISPPWSVHFGCGTSHYGFIWGMAGENQVYNDMDVVEVKSVL
ncbi:4-deoxy-L-threo-5-hexosulose-uronate ketol-isomerase [Thermoflavifilum aggregans]|uniref:4-deoxy-L-threo-5-hexosulose-uronate ketol-isomerase n=1 Tax=Thermoflavifilum aggregans TaxID=454188 RepID=A0A2M9CU13_9BACT|nr:5-dehydro-4-deoxy-D-glucuronate isomerase [Thermoflavifilum aggregans]PJJ75345.1 4-deoxy-L-threo-5-hexosulose-uronate ketol-isomerase [Thermoflavifilum aggregans]